MTNHILKSRVSELSFSDPSYFLLSTNATLSNPNKEDFWSCRIGNFVFYKTMKGEIKTAVLERVPYTQSFTYTSSDGIEKVFPAYKSKAEWRQESEILKAIYEK